MKRDPVTEATKIISEWLPLARPHQVFVIARRIVHTIMPPPVPPRVQVAWVEYDDTIPPPDGPGVVQTGWVEAVHGDVAVINCDSGPRRASVPVSQVRLIPAQS